MRDFTRHQELQGLLRSLILGEADEPLIDNLGSGFGGNITAQIDGNITGDLEVIAGPGVSHRIKECNAAAPSYCDKWIRFRCFTLLFHRLQMHSDQRAYDFQMTQFFGSDIHKEILTRRVFAIHPLDGILHGRGEFTICPTELL